MKRYIFSLIFIVPALFSMAGPAAFEKKIAKSLETTLGHYVKIQKSVNHDNNIVIAGTTTGYHTPSKVVVARFLEDGKLDSLFNGTGYIEKVMACASSVITALQILVNNKIKVSGFTNLGRFKKPFTFTFSSTGVEISKKGK